MEKRDNEKTLICHPIGYIRSPYNTREDTPKNRNERPDEEASLEFNEEYREAMADMKVGEEYLVFFWFDRAGKTRLTVPIHGNGAMTGLFSTHAPARPNPIGLTKIVITRIEGLKVYFNGADMFDGTPILDVKSAVHDL